MREVGEGDEVGGGPGEREEESRMLLSSPHHLTMSIGIHSNYNVQKGMILSLGEFAVGNTGLAF